VANANAGLLLHPDAARIAMPTGRQRTRPLGRG